MMRTTKMMVEINNTPDDGIKCKYVVVIAERGVLWYYGAYNDHSKAQQVALGLDGFVIVNE